VAVCLVVAGTAVFAGNAFGTTGSASASAQASPTVWLCRPGLKRDPCESSLTTTVVHPNGKKTTERATVGKDPPVDCFYVYPTVSAQPTVNANLNVDPELIAVAENQAARFSQVCRVYAPVYPQLTLSAIGRGASAQARAGVLSGWKEYLAKYNKGRGVVFIGHSQGSGMLIQLLKSEVDPFTWLQVTDVGKPGAPRYQPRGSHPPNWGLDLGDVNLALGNLVDLARQQAAAYHH
jgi:hypothetical protein